MNENELREYIENNFFDKKNRLKSAIIRFNYLEKIKDDLNKIKIGKSLIEKLYLFYNSIDVMPTCKECGNAVPFVSWSKGYKNYCSPQCAGKQSQRVIQKKYNVKNIFQLKDIKEKIKQTKLKKYGNKNYNNLEKTKQTNLKKYGTKNVYQSEIIKEKIKQTNLKKYGVEHNSYNEDIIIKRKNTRIISFYKNFIKRNNNLIKPLFDIKNYNGIDRTNKYKWQCLKCNTIFKDHLDDGHIPRCPICYPKLNGYSKKEKELANWCSTFTTVIENNRTILDGKEIDIYLPDYKLAIEYNGLYCHSIKFIDDKYYHQNKVELAYRKGIRLLHIWEHENIEEIKDEIQYYLDNLGIFIEVEKPKLYNINNNLIWI